MHLVVFLSLLLSSWATTTAHAYTTNSTICVEGYIMDLLCVRRGTLLDKPRYRTLTHPEQHSVHCLVDVRSCIDSGFVVLTDPTEEGADYTVGFKLNAAGTQELVQLARTTGRCSTCSGNGPVAGFRAAIQAKVLDGCANPPLIEVLSAEYAEAGMTYCDEVPEKDASCEPESLDLSSGVAEMGWLLGWAMMAGWAVLIL